MDYKLIYEFLYIIYKNKVSYKAQSRGFCAGKREKKTRISLDYQGFWAVFGRLTKLVACVKIYGTKVLNGYVPPNENNGIFVPFAPFGVFSGTVFPSFVGDRS